MENKNPMSFFKDLESPGYRAENHYFSDMARSWGLDLSHSEAALALDDPECHYIVRFSGNDLNEIYTAIFKGVQDLDGRSYVFQVVKEDATIVKAKMLRGEDFDNGHDDFLYGVSFELSENPEIFLGSKCLYDVLAIQAERCRFLPLNALDRFNDGNKL